MRFVEVKGLNLPWSVLTFGCWQIAPSEGWGRYLYGTGCRPCDQDGPEWRDYGVLIPRKVMETENPSGVWEMRSVKKNTTFW